MFNKLLPSNLKRIGTTACKVQISVGLQELTILDGFDGTICVELERGKKSLSSSIKLCSFNGFTSTVVFDEQLLLNLTLYRDSSGNFIEMKGKFNIRSHKNVLASSDLKFNSLANNFETQQIVLQFKDSKGKNIGFLKCSSTSKFLNDDDTDDASSIPSSISDSVMSETSCKDNFNGDEFKDGDKEGSNAGINTGSVAAVVNSIETKELKRLLEGKKKMMYELERYHSLIDSLELKNKLLTEDHELKKKYALVLMEEKQREMEYLIVDLKLEVVQLQEGKSFGESVTDPAKDQLSQIIMKQTSNQKQPTSQLEGICLDLKISNEVSKTLREQLEELKILFEVQSVKFNFANDMNMQLGNMLNQMTASKEIVEVALASQQALTKQVEAAFEAEKANQQKSGFQQQTDSVDLLMDKQVAGDRIAELESQMLIDKKQSDEQAKECKIISDINMSDLKSRLAEEETASMLHKEESSRLQEALDKVETNLNDALDYISVLESQAVKQKQVETNLSDALDYISVLESQAVEQTQKQDVVTDTLSTQELLLMDLKFSNEVSKTLREQLIDLKSRLAEEEVASLLHKEESSNLQEALDKVETNLSNALDYISVLKSQEVKQEQEQDVVTDTLSAQKLLILENELKENKEFSEIEHTRHEEQIISLLKMTGLYDLNLDPMDESYFEQLNQDAVEEQRHKILALKSCLFQFSGQLKKVDIEKLLNVGIILG